MGFSLPPIKLVLGIGKYDLSQVIKLKQGYIDTLKVDISFIDKEGKKFEIPSGTTAKVRMIKPDKHKVLNDTENDGTVTGNKVTFDITRQMQAHPGEGAIEIILFNAGQTVTSSTCGIIILSNVHDDSGIESTDEWLTVVNTLAEIEEALQNVNAVIEETITAKQEAETAAQRANEAAGNVTESNNFAKQSKRWAVGGVETGDSTDNSKYYAQQSANSAALAEQYSDFVYPNLYIDPITGKLMSVGGQNISFTINDNGHLISEVIF